MKNTPIFFDLDGTLTDSGPGIMNCAAEALLHFGLSVPDRQALRSFVGPPLTESLPRFGVQPHQIEEAVAVFRKRYSVLGKFENTPYPGIASLLSQLTQLGYPLYVATSKPEPMALEIMAHFALAPYFEKICGAALDGSRITKEQVLSYLMEQIHMDTPPVMVGDTIYDVVGAAHHHIPTIGVDWGYGTRESMLEAGAVCVVSTPEELLKKLTSL